ncbi:helix-turn-helix domain-containing protein [Idiomarina zobellii]|uniref:Brinker DNA-binding domain-containing protein n=1 Tax=Idiomarina zobellii TaxID=86103 RepID=A0A837NCJ5_9GAMM|nr:hypothetical protein AFK76_12770 [Idiomarina zobellii]
MSSDQEEEELQLDEDEGISINRKRKRANDAVTKLEAVQWAQSKNSIKSAAKKFGVDRKLIRNWMKSEGEIRLQV